MNKELEKTKIWQPLLIFSIFIIIIFFINILIGQTNFISNLKSAFMQLITWISLFTFLLVLCFSIILYYISQKIKKLNKPKIDKAFKVILIVLTATSGIIALIINHFNQYNSLLLILYIPALLLLIYNQIIFFHNLKDKRKDSYKTSILTIIGVGEIILINKYWIMGIIILAVLMILGIYYVIKNKA